MITKLIYERQSCLRNKIESTHYISNRYDTHVVIHIGSFVVSFHIIVDKIYKSNFLTNQFTNSTLVLVIPCLHHQTHQTFRSILQLKFTTNTKSVLVAHQFQTHHDYNARNVPESAQRHRTHYTSYINVITFAHNCVLVFVCSCVHTNDAI